MLNMIKVEKSMDKKNYVGKLWQSDSKLNILNIQLTRL